jgi:hypothetical protein
LPAPGARLPKALSLFVVPSATAPPIAHNVCSRAVRFLVFIIVVIWRGGGAPLAMSKARRVDPKSPVVRSGVPLHRLGEKTLSLLHGI